MKARIRLSARLFTALGLLLLLAAPTIAAGPPFPSPDPGRVVYDGAGIFGAATIAEATRIIEGIEARTGAEVVVYTQVKPGVSDDEAAADAQALGSQWGVGRAGFDDGLVILFDMETSGPHGAVQLQAGSGYKAAYLSDAERQSLYDHEMVPLLRDGRLDEALLAGLRAIDVNATPDHRQRLEDARILDAVLGLIVAPLAFIVLFGFAALRWYREGRDPVYIDDASIHMPAPPPGLTPAAATLLMDDQSSPKTMTTALVDLASRGEIAFEPDPGHARTEVSMLLRDPAANSDPEVLRARRLSPGAAEQGLLEGVRREAVDGRLEPDHLSLLKKAIEAFDKTLEKAATAAGWFRAPPGKVKRRWLSIGVVEVLPAGAWIWLSPQLAMTGGSSIVVAAGAAGIATMLIARFMPARTMDGARLVAWLSAYQRTLRKTLEGARSMTEVAASRVLPWAETPDQALVWGVALGLHEEVEAVLARSMAAVGTAAGGSGAWLPGWYGVGGRSTGGSPGSPASLVPDFGGMFAALNSLGKSATSSGSHGFGGGGGFGGGSVGGRF
jgi:uncharacterized membrane protein YgcG